MLTLPGWMDEQGRDTRRCTCRIQPQPARPRVGFHFIYFTLPFHTLINRHSRELLDWSGDGPEADSIWQDIQFGLKTITEDDVEEMEAKTLAIRLDNISLIYIFIC